METKPCHPSMALLITASAWISSRPLFISSESRLPLLSSFLVPPKLQGLRSRSHGCPADNPPIKHVNPCHSCPGTLAHVLSALQHGLLAPLAPFGHGSLWVVMLDQLCPSLSWAGLHGPAWSSRPMVGWRIGRCLPSSCSSQFGAEGVLRAASPALLI